MTTPIAGEKCDEERRWEDSDMQRPHNRNSAHVEMKKQKWHQ